MGIGSIYSSYTYYPNTHNVKTATTEEGLSYSFEYDTYGNNTKVSITGSDGTISSSADYTDDGNRLEYTQDALGKKTYYSYHADTNELEWVQYPNGENTDRKTKYTYDEMYRMSKAETIGENNLGMYANYAYDDEDHLASIQTPTTTYNFTYGNFGVRESVSVGNRTLATYEYTDDGNNYLKTLAYGNQDSVSYEYDKLGRLTLQTYEDDDTVKYAYDNNGDLATVVDSGSGITTKYYYDLIGRAMKYTETKSGYSHSVEYAYDTQNNLSSQTEIINGTEHNTTYTYDKDNRVTSKVTDNIGVYYTYDSFGRLTQQVTKNGDTTILTESYTYNTGSSQVATYSTAKNGSTNTISYTYDDNGNIIKEMLQTGYYTEYEYDSANQLVAEYNADSERAWLWTYDSAGNILTCKEYDYRGQLGPEVASQTYTYGDEQWGDLLKAYNGNAIEYDTIGNPETDGTWTYQWEHGRELLSMTSSTDAWTFTYNADGIRTKRTNGTRTYEYVYNGSQLVQLNVDGNTLYFTYDATGIPVTVTYNGTIYYYVTNLQGDVTSIVDASGSTQVYCTYTAYGQRMRLDGSMASTLGLYNPFWYRGYVYDTETGLYYLQSRYYDPENGRFINADSLTTTEQGLLGNNIFTYCLNNPVILKDDSGCTPTYSVDIDGDGKYDYHVYEYEIVQVYSTDSIAWTEIYTGKVYIFPETQKEYFKDKDNIPSDFNRYTDLLVADLPNTENITLYAYQAQYIPRKSYSNIADVMLTYSKDYNRDWGRTNSSLVSEWISHMVLGGILGIARSANVDFDSQEEGKNFGYFVKKAFWALLGR